MKFGQGDWNTYPVNLIKFSILPNGKVEFAVSVPDAEAVHYSEHVGQGDNFMEALSDAFKPSADAPENIGAVMKAAFLLGYRYGMGNLRVAFRDENGVETEKEIGHGSPLLGEEQ